jgi:hypothetical protein
LVHPEKKALIIKLKNTQPNGSLFQDITIIGLNVFRKMHCAEDTSQRENGIFMKMIPNGVWGKW